MRILHVVANLDREAGGPAVACLGAARLMARRGHAVRIVTTARGLAAADRAASGPVAGGGRLDIEAFPLGWPAFFGTSWPLRRRLREVVPESDVVHLHSLYLFHDWAAGAWCRRFGKPYIVRLHGTLDPYIRGRRRLRKAIAGLAFQNAVLERAAGLHYTTAEEWALALPAARNRRGAIVANGVDLDEYDALPDRAALRARYPAIGGRTVILFLGRLHEKKGLDVAIGAVARLLGGGADVFLILAGPDDGMRGSAEAWIAEAGLGGRVLFTGMVAGATKRELYAGSDIFILPSRSENFGIAVIEAAACGLPVVISDRVNLCTAFGAADAGLVAPATVGAFAAQLRQLLDEPDAARAMAARGAALVRRRFTWDALGADYETMYRTAARDGVLPVLGAAPAASEPAHA